MKVKKDQAQAKAMLQNLVLYNDAFTSNKILT